MSQHSRNEQIRKIFAISATVILVLISLYFAPSFLYHHSPNVFIPPKSIIINNSTADVMVNITNAESVPTAVPFNQEIIVDSALYQKYEAENLENVFWMTSNNTVIPSWIQSGNNRTSTNTIFWLKLPFSVGAYSNRTIYLAFGPINLNLFNASGNEGEWPGGSPVYGEYDNGPTVFTDYTNFAGTQLNNNMGHVSVSGGTYSVDNGLNLVGQYGNQYIYVFFNTPQVGIYEADITSSNTVSWGGTGIDLFSQIPGQTGGNYGIQNAYQFFQTQNRIDRGSQIDVTVNGHNTQVGYVGIYFTNYIATIYSGQGKLSWANDLSSPFITESTSQFAQPFYFGVFAGGDLTNTGLQSVQWMRIVTPFPNNVMPVYTFGALAVKLNNLPKT